MLLPILICIADDTKWGNNTQPNWDQCYVVIPLTHHKRRGKDIKRSIILLFTAFLVGVLFAYQTQKSADSAIFHAVPTLCQAV